MDLYLKTSINEAKLIFKELGFEVHRREDYYDARLKKTFGRYHALFKREGDHIFVDFHFDYHIHFMFLWVDFTWRPKYFFKNHIVELLHKKRIDYHTKTVSWFTRHNKAIITGLKLHWLRLFGRAKKIDST